MTGQAITTKKRAELTQAPEPEPEMGAGIVVTRKTKELQRARRGATLNEEGSVSSKERGGQGLWEVRLLYNIFQGEAKNKDNSGRRR